MFAALWVARRHTATLTTPLGVSATLAGLSGLCQPAGVGDIELAVIGLTGGIASGKSSVARRLRARGIPVIDADMVAREVVEVGQPTLAKIAERFGDEILLPSGALDRKGLGAIVFRDPTALSDLNALTHPAILARVAEHANHHAEAGHRWVIYEAALIIEHRLSPGLELLVAVLCNPETQITRMMARDGLSESDARRRLRAQTDNATRREHADILISNEGSLADLHAETDALIDTLRTRFGG